MAELLKHRRRIYAIMLATLFISAGSIFTVSAAKAADYTAQATGDIESVRVTQNCQQTPKGLPTNAPAPPSAKVVGPIAPADPYEYWYDTPTTLGRAGQGSCPSNVAEKQHKHPGSFLQQYKALKGANRTNAERVGGPQCVYDDDPQSPTAAPEKFSFTMEDFKKLPWAKPQLKVQPSPFALVGWNTNFYSTFPTQTQNLELAGHKVTAKAYATTFSWDHGDGAAPSVTKTPGGALPDAETGTADQTATPTSYVYQRTGELQASLTVTIVGEYSLDGAPFLPLQGSMTLTSAPVRVSVWTSEKKWVAENCQESPQAWGCSGAPSK